MPESRRGRPRSIEARQSILGAAADLLIAHGLDNLSIDEIASVAGVSRQTIYRWWSSKAEIITEAVLEGLLSGPDISLASSRDLRRDLHQWIERSAHYLEHNRGLARATGQMAATDPRVAALLFEKFTRPGLEALNTRLERARADGEIRSGADIHAAIDALSGVLAFLSLANASAERGAAMVDVILDGLR